MIPDEPEIGVRVQAQVAADHDFTIRLNEQRVGFIKKAAQVGGRFPIPAEGGIEGAIGFVPGDGKIKFIVDGGKASDYDFAVRLERHGVGPVIAVSKTGRLAAIIAESGIGPAIREETRHGEDYLAAIVRKAGDHDLAVGLHRDRLAVIVPVAESRGHLAGVAEIKVQSAGLRRKSGSNQQQQAAAAGGEISHGMADLIRDGGKSNSFSYRKDRWSGATAFLTFARFPPENDRPGRNALVATSAGRQF